MSEGSGSENGIGFVPVARAGGGDGQIDDPYPSSKVCDESQTLVRRNGAVKYKVRPPPRG